MTHALKYFKFRCEFAEVETNMCGPTLCSIAHDHGSKLCRIARDQIAWRWINWSNFRAMLYDLKNNLLKNVHR
jgi:hypothetical protein